MSEKMFVSRLSLPVPHTSTGRAVSSRSAAVQTDGEASCGSYSREIKTTGCTLDRIGFLQNSRREKSLQSQRDLSPHLS